MFAERLALDSLSESDFLSLLAEPPESLQAGIPEIPDWLAALRDAFTEGQEADEMLSPLFKEIETGHLLAGCLPALSPLLQRGLSSVQQAAQALRYEYTFLPFEIEILPKAFLTNIASDILAQFSKPVILEMHISRLQGRLQGETPEDRFSDFMRQLSQEGLIVPLLAKYPVLARQLLITIDQWADFLSKFLAHLCADWKLICTTFTPERDPGMLVEVDAGKGDRHRRGRSVLHLRFGSGLQLLYKPKPLTVDVHFQELLTWLNERGAEPPVRPLQLIDRGDYGWSEFVIASPCTSREQVARFYERQGSYLALLYALNATDLHNENLIAAGEHPMFVDLEALFHPHVHSTNAILTNNLAARAIDQSVWQVGLLPRRLPAGKDSLGIDMSGLGGLPGQMMPYQLVHWQEAGSDQMRITRQRIEIPVSQNRPRLGDQDVDVLDYKDAIITGFVRMYRLLCHERDTLLEEQLPRFARDEIRVIVRSTRIYGSLLYESFHPDLLRDALDRDRFFDRLWVEVTQRPHLARAIPAERQDLLQGDIPLFSTYPDTFVSEGGSALSGGQRQRLAIARSVAHKPRILLLDEATSHLDVTTEQSVADHLQTLACTQIIIAHRLSTIRSADLILVLDEGRIVERGPHLKLIQRQGYYARLMQRQLENGNHDLQIEEFN